MSDEQLLLDLAELSRINGIVATYCDRTAHNEPVDSGDLRGAGRRLRRLALLMAETAGLSLRDRYADRLAQVEAASVYETLVPSPSVEIREARSWRDLQVAQLRHDHRFHPDVYGMPRSEQLVHISLHLAKLVGALGAQYQSFGSEGEDFYRRRLPDMLLFGIKLSTVAGERMDDCEPLDIAEAESQSTQV